MDHELIAGRSFGEVYRVTNRADLHAFLVEAVEASGARVLYVSDAGRAPVYLGVRLDSDERLGMLIYPFRVTRNTIRNRPADEVRGQLRYGSEESWERAHPVGRDVAGVDVTMIVGIDLEDRVLIGLDSSLWDPLPMGISFYAKVANVVHAQQNGWHVWEKVNRAGSKRSQPRSSSNLETVVAFRPERLIDYARLERRASLLGLDQPLRYSAAVAMTKASISDEALPRHVLEDQFDLSSEQILNIINGRTRLAVAVRGGVAEHHLEQQLSTLPYVSEVRRLDIDAMHDFDVVLATGDMVRVECKNASPNKFRNGSYRVEVQKTRASKGDPASRFYPVDAFDVVAACLFSATGAWRFVFGRTADMQRHNKFSDRLAPVQEITESWVSDLASL